MALDIRPDRHNWQQFCAVQPLTDEELAAWNQFARAIRTANLVNSMELDDFISQMTMDESKEMHRQDEQSQTADWSDVVAFADANRRLKRAEIAAWVQWQALTGARGGEAGDGLDS